MSLGKQAQRLNDRQAGELLYYVEHQTWYPARNAVIVRFSLEVWNRAIEIANVRWRMVTDSVGALQPELRLENLATKGRTGGRVIPLVPALSAALERLYAVDRPTSLDAFIIRLRGHAVDRVNRSQSVQWLFRQWYRALGYHGCSSHSGRRTGITKAARVANEKVSGASLEDVRRLAGHTSLLTTQRYIDENPEAQRRLLALTAIKPVVVKAGLHSRGANTTPFRRKANGIA
jgi:integrase/recombinase XerD